MKTPCTQGDVLQFKDNTGFLLCTTSQNAAGNVRISIVQVERTAYIGEVGVYKVLRQDGLRMTPLKVSTLERVGWAHVGHAVPNDVTATAYRQAQIEVDKEQAKRVECAEMEGE